MNNAYGINDNFNTENGHVVPSLIHKFYLAKKKQQLRKIVGKSEKQKMFTLFKRCGENDSRNCKERNTGY